MVNYQCVLQDGVDTQQWKQSYGLENDWAKF
jgi:hypothetical protein